MSKKGMALGVVLLAVWGTAWGLEGLQVGMRAPGFSLRDLRGGNVSLADFRESKLIVVTFFATWSENSAELLERLQKLYQQYEQQGLAVVAVNVESLQISTEEEAAVARMVQSFGLSFPILIDRGLEVFRSYGVVAVPSTVVADPEGKIVGELAGFPIALREDLFDLIEAGITGKARQKVQKVGYEPEPRALRYYNLGKAMMTRGSEDMAEVNLRRAIDSDPRFAFPLVLLGQLLKARAQTEESIEFHGRTITTANFSAEERQRALQEAGTLLRKALEVDAQNIAAMTELGDLMAQEGQAREAEEWLQKALQANDAYTPAYCVLGRVLLERGEVAGAQQAFASATRLNPLDYKCYLTFAQAYEGKGRQQEAVELYRKTLELLWTARHDLFPFSLAR